MENPAPMQISDIRAFYALDDQLATSGQPEAAQLPLLKQAGYTRIINLACDDSPLALTDEAALIQALDLEYIHIPVDFHAPQPEALQEFFHVMQQPAQKSLVHCAYNWRVACFVYLYRSLHNKTPEAAARKDLLAVWRPDPTWQAFIDQARHAFNQTD